MNTAIIGAFNVDSERLLGAGFLAVDAVHEPLRVIKILMEGMAPDASDGYWLVDFHGLPVARAHLPYGLLYLDEGHRVIQAIAVSPNSVFEPIRGVPMSALVVSATALVASRTKAGDQLLLSLVKRTTGEPVAVAEPKAPLPGEVRPRVFSIGNERTVTVQGNWPQRSVQSGPLLNSAASVEPPADVADAGAKTREASSEETVQPVVESTVIEARQEIPEPGSPPTVLENSPLEISSTETASTEDSVKVVSAAEIAVRVEANSAPDSVARALQRREPEPEDHPLSVKMLYALFPELHPSYRPDFVAPRADSWREKTTQSFEPATYVRALSLLYPELKLENVVRQQREKRRAPRIANPGLVGHYYNGGAPEAHEIRSLSLAGFFMCTHEKWLPGTIVRITLQKPCNNDSEPEMSLTVSCRVVNVSPEGTGFEFVLPGLFD